jgi:hypothetical protein
VIVLAVEGLEAETATRIGDVLARRFQAGFVGIAHDPRNDLITVLARADSDATAAQTVEIVRGLGLKAREANEGEYDTAQAVLNTGELSITASSVSAEGVSASEALAAGSALQSLGAWLAPLRERFNRAKGKLRFVAILSPT